MAKYLKDNKNVRFAKQCRESILEANGRVKFPSIPIKKRNIPLNNKAIDNH